VTIYYIAHSSIEDGIAEEFQPLIVQRLSLLIAPSDALVHKSLTIIVDVMRIEPKNIVESRKKLLLLAERELNTVNDIINPHIS
jgi:hypothetical protein